MNTINKRITNHNILNNFNYFPGEVYSEVREFDFNKPVSIQTRNALDEDFLFVFYPNNICLEVGWLHSGNFRKGKFVISIVIRNEDFEEFYFYYNVTRKKNELIKFVFEAHDVAIKLLNKIKSNRKDFIKCCISAEKIDEIFFSIPN
ncbi:MAG: hypothetical protein NTW25_09600 [Candidatus Kapabacteria bacterium]|nr:hypothetical protein [Candidatus Kapabacteria bacterium]